MDTRTPNAGQFNDSFLLAQDADAQRARAVAALLWEHKALSRSQIRVQTGDHATLIGNAVERLFAAELIREQGELTPAGGLGRPQVSLEIDADSRRVVGLTVEPKSLRAVCLNLRGQSVAPPIRVPYADARALTQAAGEIVGSFIDPKIIAVGLSVTGFLDVERAELLFSSAIPDSPHFSLRPMVTAIAERAPQVPIVPGNDQHALAARWVLTTSANTDEDTLLVGCDDGRLGAAMLIGGVPNRGCVMGGNEIGHMKLGFDTDRCFCGGVGCLERIGSSGQLKRMGCTRQLLSVVQHPGNDLPVLQSVLGKLGMGLANAVQLVRPARLVICGPFAAEKHFTEIVEPAIRANLLPELRERVAIDWWAMNEQQSAENAAWLALARIFSPRWAEYENLLAGKASA